MTTYFNTKDGVILSQTDGENTWYFQYDTNGTPLGFVLNGTQYFYITNQMGDVLAITDTNGEIVGNYEYDAWGKVLTADTDIAKQNPIRYRGYYYDNETGYYYLQSRYYDSNTCRFINADNYCNTGTGTVASLNMYAYCDNEPLNSNDYNGEFKKSKHEDIAYDVAKQCGFSSSVAKSIAKNCRALDDVYPSTAYAKNFMLHYEERIWQYYHFNGYKSGNKDTRVEYANSWLNRAINYYKKGKRKDAYKWLGYALHCLQDREAHGQIGRGEVIPEHIFSRKGEKNRTKADTAIGYEWTNSKRNALKYVPFSHKRVNAAKKITRDYLLKFKRSI